MKKYKIVNFNFPKWERLSTTNFVYHDQKINPFYEYKKDPTNFANILATVNKPLANRQASISYIQKIVKELDKHLLVAKGYITNHKNLVYFAKYNDSYFGFKDYLELQGIDYKILTTVRGKPRGIIITNKQVIEQLNGYANQFGTYTNETNFKQHFTHYINLNINHEKTTKKQQKNNKKHNQKPTN